MIGGSKKDPLKIGKVGEYVRAGQLVPNEELGKSVALLASETLLSDEEVEHGNVLLEGDHVELERERAGLEVELPADMVEQREASRGLDTGQLAESVGIDLLVEDCAMVLEHRYDLRERVPLVVRAVGLVSDPDGVSSKDVLKDPVADFSWQSQQRRVALVVRPSGIVSVCSIMSSACIYSCDSFDLLDRRSPQMFLWGALDLSAMYCFGTYGCFGSSGLMAFSGVMTSSRGGVIACLRDHAVLVTCDGLVTCFARLAALCIPGKNLLARWPCCLWTSVGGVGSWRTACLLPFTKSWSFMVASNSFRLPWMLWFRVGLTGLSLPPRALSNTSERLLFAGAVSELSLSGCVSKDTGPRKLPRSEDDCERRARGVGKRSSSSSSLLQRFRRAASRNFVDWE